MTDVAEHYPTASTPEQILDIGADVLLRTFSRLGHPVSRESLLLDFGCGKGAMVTSLAQAGYAVWGTDFEPPQDVENSRLKKLHSDPYRLPFENSSFDHVVSCQVLEHVQNHPVAFREISRVMKRGGAALHVYPSRWAPLERHTFVPFAGVFRADWYLRFWARIGVRNAYQETMSSDDTARHNARYLAEGTNYLSRTETIESARPYFSEVRFCERAFMAEHPRELFRKTATLPLADHLYALLRGNVLLMIK